MMDRCICPKCPIHTLGSSRMDGLGGDGVDPKQAEGSVDGNEGALILSRHQKLHSSDNIATHGLDGLFVATPALLQLRQY